MRLSRPSTAVLIVALVVGLFAAGALTAVRDSSLLPGWLPFVGEPYIVHDVISGDTIEVIDENGVVSQVQMLGIDAPDMGSEGEESECGADEATSFVSEQVSTGMRVYLVRDGEADDKDRDGRLLRYVEIGFGTDIGKKVLSEGYATNWNVRTGPKFERGDDYRETVVIALDHGKGLWDSFCDM